MTPFPPHPFAAAADPRITTCVKCGKRREHPVHLPRAGDNFTSTVEGAAAYERLHGGHRHTSFEEALAADEVDER